MLEKQEHILIELKTSIQSKLDILSGCMLNSLEELNPEFLKSLLESQKLVTSKLKDDLDKISDKTENLIFKIIVW